MSLSKFEEWALVMPFVVCRSQGGTFDDESFVAGYEVGMVFAVLARHAPQVALTVHSANLPQLDLVAMRHGYEMQVLDALDVDGWSQVLFQRVAAVGA